MILCLLRTGEGQLWATLKRKLLIFRRVIYPQSLLMKSRIFTLSSIGALAQDSMKTLGY